MCKVYCVSSMVDFLLKVQIVLSTGSAGANARSYNEKSSIACGILNYESTDEYIHTHNHSNWM